LPAAALLIAERVTSIRSSSDFQWTLRITGLLCLLLGVVAVVHASRSGMITIWCAVLVSLPLVIAGACSLVSRWRTNAGVIIAGSVLSSLVVVLNCAAAKVGHSESVRDLLQAADSRGYANATVFTRRGYD